ncbi:MAG: NADH-quinone oxidoreductase subunit E [Pseudomonadota bacterium]
MSNRRLAPDHVQPDSFAFARDKEASAKKWIKKYPKGKQASAVIPLLWLAQEQEGWVSKPCIENVAERLDMPFIRVLEVATFYTMFQLQPVGKRAHIQVCGTTPCMLRGAEDLKEVCRKRISPNQFEVVEDGNLSWEEVECAGACVNAPMVQIFSDTFEDLTPETLEDIIDKFAAGTGNLVKPGPQIDRHYSMPAGGATTLTDETIYKARAKGGTTKAKNSDSKAAAKPAATKAAKPRAATLLSTDTIKKPGKSAAAKAVAEAEAKAGATPSSKGGKAVKPVRASAGAAKLKTAPAQGAIGEVSAGKKPRTLKAPKKSGADDLKMVSGIGPVNEKRLNDLGIFHFDQVAKWGQSEIDWVNGYLSFKGRIEREDWVAQADALAAGGRDEYVKRFGKEPR